MSLLCIGSDHVGEKRHPMKAEVTYIMYVNHSAINQ